MSKSQEKILALSLRRKGWSIKDIAKSLSVSRSSVSVWCQEVELSQSQKALLYKKQIAAGNKGRLLGAEMNRQKRLTAIESYVNEGARTVDKLSNRDLMMLGIGLYWGEGVKSRTSPATLVNSDPQIILLGKRWMEECLMVKTELFRPYLYINESQKHKSSDILKFWVNILNIPASQFHTPFIVKHVNKKYYENHEQYRGVLALRVMKGTALKYKILGLIKACSRP